MKIIPNFLREQIKRLSKTPIVSYSINFTVDLYHRISAFFIVRFSQKPLHRVLCQAAEQGQVHLVESCLKAGVYVNETYDGSTALHYAAGRGHAKVVALLLKSKANYNYATQLGKITPLETAAANGQCAVVEQLVKAGATSPRAYVSAIQKGHVGVLRLLDQAGIKPEAQDFPIHAASASMQVAVLKYLIEEKKEPIDQRNAQGETPLHVAAASGTIDAVNYLLLAGAQTNTQDKNYRTPLISAIRNWQNPFSDQIIQQLLAHKADPNLGQENGGSALYEAVDRNRLQVVEALLKAEADIAFKKYQTLSYNEKQGTKNAHSAPLTAFDKAAFDGKADMIKALIPAVNKHPKAAELFDSAYEWAQRGKQDEIVLLLTPLLSRDDKAPVVKFPTAVRLKPKVSFSEPASVTSPKPALK